MYIVTLKFPTQEQRDAAISSLSSGNAFDLLKDEILDDGHGEIELESQDDETIVYSEVEEEDEDEENED